MGKRGAAPIPVEERFWAHVDKTGDCWIWTAATDRDGYGRVAAWGVPSALAHRVAWRLTYGSYPESRLDHRCRRGNVGCVRPDHLRLATAKQNAENQSGAQCNSKSGVRGVSWSSRRSHWRVTATHNGKQHYGGVFKDITEAEAAAIELRNRLFTHNDADREIAA